MSAALANATAPVCYGHVVEALLLKAFRDDLDRPAHDALDAIGVNLDRPLKTFYPADVADECMRIVRRTLFPHLTDAEAYRAIGERFVHSYLDTTIGRLATPLIKMMGPRRMLHQLSRFFEGGGNYVSARCVDVSPCAVEVHVSDHLVHPAYLSAIIEHGCLQAGAASCRVDVMKTFGRAVTYRVTWVS